MAWISWPGDSCGWPVFECVHANPRGSQNDPPSPFLLPQQRRHDPDCRSTLRRQRESASSLPCSCWRPKNRQSASKFEPGCSRSHALAPETTRITKGIRGPLRATRMRTAQRLAIAREQLAQTLSPTALVHEAFLGLGGQTKACRPTLGGLEDHLMRNGLPVGYRPLRGRASDAQQNISPDSPCS